jgi:hypothetical protein
MCEVPSEIPPVVNDIYVANKQQTKLLTSVMLMPTLMPM